MVGRDHDSGRGLVDDVVDRAASVIVVACAIGERPSIGVVDRVGVSRATEVETAQDLVQHALSRTCGGVRHTVVGHMVGGYRDCGVGLCDLVSDRAAGVIVVACAVGKSPGVGVSAGVGVSRATEIQAAQGHVVDTLGRAGGRMGVAVVSDIVGCYRDCGVGLCDLVSDRAAGVIVVACAVGKSPGVGVSAGVGVSRATEIQAAQGHVVDTLGRAGGRMGVAVVSDIVGRYRDCGVGLCDLVSDRAAGVIVVACAVGKSPGVGVSAGVGVSRATEIQAAQGH